jgi:hypothetical protein
MRAHPLLILLAALPLRAGDDATGILQRLVDAQTRNDRMARQYTCLEETEWFTYSKNGQLHKNRSETHEIIFVEGVKYKKLTARNGKPLSAREAAQVDNEMRETAEERRRHPQTAPGGSINFGNQHADIGSLAELLSLFDNRVTAEEEIRGRKAWVIESAPRAGHAPASPHEKDVLSYRKKLWIDEADNVMVRMVATVAGEGLFAAPGSSLTFEYDKVDQQVWQAVSVILDVTRQAGKVTKAWARTEYRESRFQKFDVQSTITVEAPK